MFMLFLFINPLVYFLAIKDKKEEQNMKKFSKFLTILLIEISFCFSSLAMNEEQLESAPRISVHPVTTLPEETSVLERLRELSLRPIPTPSILKERLLSTPEQHVQFLKAALRSAYERVVIISPYISIYRLRENDEGGFYDDIEEATRRGVKITVFTDVDLDTEKPNTNNGWKKLLKPNAADGRRNLVKAYVDLHIVDRIHSKNLIVDDNLITFGSFNWLSAVINSTSEWCRYETSTVIKDDHTPTAIQRLLGELEALPVRDAEGYHAFYRESIPATTDFREAIKLYKKYVTHPLYKSVTEALMSSYADSSLQEGLAIIRTLQQTGAPAEELLGKIWALTEFHVGDAREFLDILQVLEIISPTEAMNVAMDKRSGLLTRLDRARDYEHLDFMYNVLTRMNMRVLAEKVEFYILTGELED